MNDAKRTAPQGQLTKLKPKLTRTPQAHRMKKKTSQAHKRRKRRKTPQRSQPQKKRKKKKREAKKKKLNRKVKKSKAAVRAEWPSWRASGSWTAST